MDYVLYLWNKDMILKKKTKKNHKHTETNTNKQTQNNHSQTNINIPSTIWTIISERSITRHIWRQISKFFSNGEIIKWSFFSNLQQI